MQSYTLVKEYRGTQKLIITRGSEETREPRLVKTPFGKLIREAVKPAEKN